MATKFYLGLGLAAALLASASCHRETCDQIREVAAKEIANVDVMPEFRSRDPEELCRQALSMTGRIYSQRMDSAGYSFSPGGGYWFRYREASEGDQAILARAGQTEEVRLELFDLCNH